MITEPTLPSPDIPPPPPSGAISPPHLPTELLITILSPFSTVSLLPFIRISRRFAHLILSLLHTRLLAATNLTGTRHVQLECYRPLDRLRAETLLCVLQGTQGLAPPHGQRSIVDTLRSFNSAFTRFKPYRRGSQQVQPRRHPAGDVPGSRTYEDGPQGQAQTSIAAQGKGKSSSSTAKAHTSIAETDVLLPPPKQPLHLDQHEAFTQLQTTTSLATTGPKRGLVYSAITASEGVVRVFRDWLEEQHQRRKHGMLPAGPVSLDDSGILWVNDRRQNVGVRFTVEERKWRRDVPVLMHIDEDAPVTYELQIEEVVMRTRHLLYVTEEGIRERLSAVGGKAIVIGNWLG